MRTKLILISENQFREAMALKGYTQGALAKEAGVDQSYVSLIVTGKMSPGPRTAEKIAKALDGEIKDYFYVKVEYDSNQEKVVSI